MKPLPARATRVAVAGVVALGAALRIIEYHDHRPLWVDEAMVALNIGRHSFAGLLGKLQYDQAAPILFLWGIKLVSMVGGMGEYALRFLPFIGSLLITWLVWRMGKAIAGEGAGLIAAALIAISGGLIYYSAELKPYGLDAVVSTLLVLLTLRVRDSPDRAARWWKLGAGGIIGFLSSTPSPLVLAACVAALAADSRIRKDPAARKAMVVVCLAWAAGGLAIYRAIYLPEAHNAYLRRYWEGTFLDFHAPDISTRLFHTSFATFRFLPILGHFRMVWCVVALAAGIGVVAFRRGISSALLVGVPFAAVLTAALLSLYPVDGRLFVFLMPFVYVGVAAAGAELVRLTRLPESYVGIVGLALTLVLGTSGVLRYLRHPKNEAGRIAAQRVLKLAGSEPLYILPDGVPEWVYYATDWSRPDTTRLDHFAALAQSTGPSSQNSLIPAVTPPPPYPLEYQARERLELVGRRSGVAFREPSTYLQNFPDSAWARLEVDRIKAVARPFAWVFGGHWNTKEVPYLRAEFLRRGVVITESMQEHRGVSLRLRFPVDSLPDTGRR